jgi:hypothetical protein
MPDAVQVTVTVGSMGQGGNAFFFQPMSDPVMRIVTFEALAYPDTAFDVGKAAAEAMIVGLHRYDAMHPEEQTGG